MPLCAANNCSNRFEDGFRLFLFPTDEHRKKQWLINMGREDFTPSKISCVCEVHFDESQWVQNLAAGWKKLKPNAIPTLFSNPIHLLSFNETNVDVPNFLQICRICLSPNNDLINLFKPSSNDKLPYLEFMEQTSLQVSSDDGLPPYVCNECFQTILEIKNFKQKCIQSANLLKNYNGPNTIASLNAYIISKTQSDGIVHVDKKENLETTNLENKNQKEKNEQDTKYKLEEIDNFYTFPDPIDRKNLKNEPYSVCHICGAKAKYILKHLKTHNDTYDLKCDICGKQFRHNIALLRHLSDHRREKSEVKPQCGICHKTFYDRHTLRRHIKTVHQDTRPFKCTLCPKSFHDERILRIHMVTHTGERRYKCDVQGCSRTYTQSTPLAQHKLKCHSNNVSEITKFKCKICSKAFKQKKTMEEHLRFHSGVRCTKCNKSFTSIKKLNIHMRDHFGIVEKKDIEAKNKQHSELLESIDNLIQQEQNCTQADVDLGLFEPIV
ncbi:zinc finger protein 184-like [Chrysoperla carnea]|uniref:zinc finger protein 184-like n=1 Tax=Chrysoperla carnea TaxID=189513 RepID=UPI001D08B6EB|nr:zinc finger protein 184-like [Chrysoperla carnea]